MRRPLAFSQAESARPAFPASGAGILRPLAYGVEEGRCAFPASDAAMGSPLGIALSFSRAELGRPAGLVYHVHKHAIFWCGQKSGAFQYAGRGWSGMGCGNKM